MIDFSNRSKYRGKLNTYDVSDFQNVKDSYKYFVRQLKVESFRHLKDLEINFDHPITVLSGSNKIGKTSLLLLLACSHERFMKLDSSKPSPTLREHIWRDVITFTKYETEHSDYSYTLSWRLGKKNHSGRGKRLASSKAWSGLAKKAKDRINAKIKGREVRYSDLDRIMPARSFSNSLIRKALKSPMDLSEEIARAYCYILQKEFKPDFKIQKISEHVNKCCYLIQGDETYSSYNSASGEDCLINLLIDVFDSPENSLVLIDEIEAGFHPSIQRRLAEVIECVSWEHKKQFVITTHSPTVIDSFSNESRKFLEKKSDGTLKVLPGISHLVARSKMDIQGYPLAGVFCEDDLMQFIIKRVLVSMEEEQPDSSKLVKIIRSGGAQDVVSDLKRHRVHREQDSSEILFGAVVDGDMFGENGFKDLSDDDQVFFFGGKNPPEKELIQAYLDNTPNEKMSAELQYTNPHELFRKMVDHGLASDKGDARSKAFASYQASEKGRRELERLHAFLVALLERGAE